MIMTVDIGNTNVKIGVFDNNKLVDSFKLNSDVNRTSNEYLALLTQLLAYNNVDASKINGGIISSVIPGLDYTFKNVLEYAFHFTAIVVGVGVKTGIDIKYDNPRELGSDRIASCVGAVVKYGTPVIVLDFGTATTYNVVNEKKQFMGGCITLGIKSTVDALATSTSKLNRVDLEVPTNIVGRNTINAIQSGVLHGAVGQVKYLTEKIKDELHLENCKVVATGGLSEFVASIDPIFHAIDRELSLYGLNYIYQINNK